jgi:hypothetical protein
MRGTRAGQLLSSGLLGTLGAADYKTAASSIAADGYDDASGNGQGLLLAHA